MAAKLKLVKPIEAHTVVRHKSKYQRIEDTVRPYRLWNSVLKADMPHRYYSRIKNAHIGALIDLKYAKVGVTIEVYNAKYGKLICPYTRHVDGITIPKDLKDYKGDDND